MLTVVAGREAGPPGWLSIAATAFWIVFQAWSLLAPEFASLPLTTETQYVASAPELAPVFVPSAAVFRAGELAVRGRVALQSWRASESNTLDRLAAPLMAHRLS
jgi:hypothetical protein